MENTVIFLSLGIALCFCLSIQETQSLSIGGWPWYDCGYTCDIWCPYGRVTDRWGCATCECRKLGECPPLNCKGLSCTHGHMEYLGCPLCACKPDPCGTKSICPAQLKCPFGYKTDENGCRTCECKDPCGTKSICPALFKCPFGYKTDENGCRTCECKDPCGTKSICPALFKCPFGYKTDENGCRTCECKGAPTS